MGRVASRAPFGEVGARLDARRTRAHRVAVQHGASAAILGFYADAAALQQVIVGTSTEVLRAGEAPFADRLDPVAATGLMPMVIHWLQRDAPANIRAIATTLDPARASHWQTALERCWRDGGAARDPVDALEAFALELLLQPYAEAAALGPPQSSARLEPPQPARCPRCGGLPIVATLRERGHGAARALVCGLCLTEWAAHRLVCPACGEHNADALAGYKAEEFPAVRIDACNTCKVYMKAIDLTVDGLAIPIVDDLASVPADLWAAEQGYDKLRPNLLRL